MSPLDLLFAKNRSHGQESLKKRKAKFKLLCKQNSFLPASNQQFLKKSNPEEGMSAVVAKIIVDKMLEEKRAYAYDLCEETRVFDIDDEFIKQWGKVWSTPEPPNNDPFGYNL